MTSTFKQSRDDEDEYSEIDTQASDLFGELTKSVSKLRALSYELGDNSGVHLEHTLDAILNMAQKTTFDESITSMDSLRVARPVHRNVQKEKDSSRCNIRLLLCSRSEKKEDNEFAFPDVTSLQSRLGSRSKESFWREIRPSDMAEQRQKSSRQISAERDECDTSQGYSTNSKKNLVVNVGRKNTDDISSLSSDLFASRRAYDSEARNAIVTRSSPDSNCLSHYEDLLTCRTPHRQLPIDEGHGSFFDLLTCHRSAIERRERQQDEEDNEYDHNMKILGVRNNGDSTVSTRSGSQSTGRSGGSLDQRKPQSQISRVEAEHSPKLFADQMARPDRATVYIYNQRVDQARRKR